MCRSFLRENEPPSRPCAPTDYAAPVCSRRALSAHKETLTHQPGRGRRHDDPRPCRSNQAFPFGEGGTRSVTDEGLMRAGIARCDVLLSVISPSVAVRRQLPRQEEPWLHPWGAVCLPPRFIFPPRSGRGRRRAPACRRQIWRCGTARASALCRSARRSARR